MVERGTWICMLALLGVTTAACGGDGGAAADAAGADAAGADAVRNDNASLSALSVTRGALVPPFEPAITEYTLDLPLTDEDVAFTPSAAVPTGVTITIAGEVVATGAISSVLSLLPGGRDVDIVVTATAGTAETYRIHVRRGVPGIELSSAGGALSNRLVPAFDPATPTYTLDIGLWLAQLQLAVIPEVAGSTITINGAGVPAATASSPVVLNVGSTTIMVVVTPPAGPMQTYSIEVTRAVPTHRTYVKASNPGGQDFLLLGDLFGVTVALSKDTLVVGAPLEASSAVGVNGNQADNSAINSGAVYVYVRSGATWVQQAYLKASNAEALDDFGSALALSGDTLVVTARGESSAATGVDGNQADNSVAGSGAAYVFTRAGTTWTQQAFLKASNTDASDVFGTSVAIHGDTIAVGAVGESSAATGVGGDQADDSAGESGAVYVFTRTGATWAQQAYLKASNAGTGDRFGGSVALWGDTIAVGARLEDSAATGVGGDQSDNGAAESGAVYVFTRAGATWSQQAYLKASNTDAGDELGNVSLWGDTLVVGAAKEDSAATAVGGDQMDDSAAEAGAAYVFQRTGTTWAQQAYLKAGRQESGDQLGAVVAIWGDAVVVGASYEGNSATGVDVFPLDNTAPQSGSAFAFYRRAGVWFNGVPPPLFPIQPARGHSIKASNTEAGDRFGMAVALWGDTLAVSAIQESSSAAGIDGDQGNNNAIGSGAVYVVR